MSWWNRITHTFPVTSDVWWTVTLGIGTLFLLLIATGELLWLAKVKNFTALTWYIRFSVPSKWLIVWAVVWGATSAWLIWHFVWGSGWKAGPNI